MSLAKQHPERKQPKVQGTCQACFSSLRNRFLLMVHHLRVNVWVRMSWEQVVEEKGVHNVTYLLTPVTGFPLQQAEKPFAAANYRGRNSFLLQGDKGEDLQLLTNCSVCINFPLIPMKENDWYFFPSVLIFLQCPPEKSVAALSLTSSDQILPLL